MKNLTIKIYPSIDNAFSIVLPIPEHVSDVDSYIDKFIDDHLTNVDKYEIEKDLPDTDFIIKSNQDIINNLRSLGKASSCKFALCGKTYDTTIELTADNWISLAMPGFLIPTFITECYEDGSVLLSVNRFISEFPFAVFVGKQASFHNPDNELVDIFNCEETLFSDIKKNKLIYSKMEEHNGISGKTILGDAIDISISEDDEIRVKMPETMMPRAFYENCDDEGYCYVSQYEFINSFPTRLIKYKELKTYD